MDERVVAEGLCEAGWEVTWKWGAWCEGNRSQLHDNATIDGVRRGGCVVYIGIIKMPPPPSPWTMGVKRINQPGDMIFPATNSPLYAFQLRINPEGIVSLTGRWRSCTWSDIIIRLAGSPSIYIIYYIYLLPINSESQTCVSSSIKHFDQNRLVI